jgi:hypothetical protein
MKKLILLSILAASTSAWSADFTVRAGEENTVAVQGCEKAEIGVVKLNSSSSGEHKLTSRCLPIYCAYRNETPLTWFGTKWTIKLLARDSARETHNRFNSPIFDRSLDQTLHTGIETKEERDQIIKNLLDEGTCKAVFYDQKVPAV